MGKCITCGEEAWRECHECLQPVCGECEEVVDSFNGLVIKPRTLCGDCHEMGLWIEGAEAEVMAQAEDDDGMVAVVGPEAAGLGVERSPDDLADASVSADAGARSDDVDWDAWSGCRAVDGGAAA